MTKRFDTASLHTPLSKQLSTGFQEISLSRAHGRLYAVTLWRDNGSCLRIQSKTFDVSHRLELGYLTFSEDAPSSTEAAVSRFGLPDTMRGPLIAFKLVITTDAVDIKGVKSESGLVLQSATKDEIIIVSSEAPFGIAIAAHFIPEEFTPEYDLTEYERVPI